MIPVTSFAGKTCRLRPRRLRPCELPRAQGRRRRGDCRRRQRRQRRQGGAGRLHHRRPALRVWNNFAALILTPGAPLTHPAPHWSVLMARAGRRRGDRRHRIVLPRATAPRAGCAVRRHHRHQRQVHHDGADRASDEGCRLRHPDGRQYRHRDPVAGAAADGARACDRDVVVPDRSGALARSVRRHSAQCQRRPYRSPRHAGALRGGEGAARRRRAAAGHARSSASTTAGAATSPTGSIRPASAWCASP